MQLILEQEGYQVQTSLNGACFHEMKSDLPALILLDVLLYGGNLSLLSFSSRAVR